jgi:mannose-6-phosphate isomerase-like protein (cupin superfamily)
VTTIPSIPSTLNSPQLLKWRRYRREVSWSSEPGASIGLGPDIECTSIKAHALIVPVGQRYQQVRQAETVLVGMQGTLNVAVGGVQHELKANDLVFVPAGGKFALTNIGLSSGLCCEIVSNMPDGDNPGPVVTDAVRMAWRDARRSFHWNLPYADIWGYHRGSGPFFVSNKLRGHMVRQPMNQGCPWHAPTRDLAFVQLSGEVSWTAAGGAWLLQPRDLFIMPAGTPYVYANHGENEAIFFDIGGPRPPGKATVYWKSDPGWPIRDDAEILPTTVGSDGNARIA